MGSGITDLAASDAIVIVGAGPAGLLAAKAALDLNKKVTLIEKRQIVHTRYQRIEIPENLMRILLRYAGIESEVVIHEARDINGLAKYDIYGLKTAVETLSDPDKAFFTKIIESDFVIPINFLEKYFLDKIKYHKNLTIKTDSKVTKIDESGKKITLSSGGKVEQLDYTFLILADGASRSVTKTTSLGKEGNQVPLAHHQVSVHGSCLFDCDSLDIPERAKGKISSITTRLETTQLSLADLMKLQWKHGWHLYRLPIIGSRITLNTGPHGKDQVYVAGEIPKKLAEALEKAKASGEKTAEETALKNIWDYYQTIAEMEFTQIKNLQFTTGTTFTLSENALRDCLTDDGSMMVIGDAYLPACYLYGHGIIEAFHGAFAVKDVLLGESPVEVKKLLSERVEHYNAITPIYYRSNVNIFRRIPYLIMGVLSSLDFRKADDKISVHSNAYPALRGKDIISEVQQDIKNTTELCLTAAESTNMAVYLDVRKTLIPEKIDHIKLYVQLPVMGFKEIPDEDKAQAIINSCIIKLCSRKAPKTYDDAEAERKLIQDLSKLNLKSSDSKSDFPALYADIIDTLKKHRMHIVDPNSYEKIVSFVYHLFEQFGFSNVLKKHVEQRLSKKDQDFIKSVEAQPNRKPKI